MNFKLLAGVTVWLLPSFFGGVLLASDNLSKPNVLFIIVDDLATSDSHGAIETPAIDDLADRGYRFANNFANVPVCGASRASLLSGLAPSTERFLTYNTRLDVDAPDVASLPAFFKQNGWYTLANGKVFDVISDSAQSWSEPVWNPDPQWHSNQEVDERGEHLQKGYLQALNSGRPPTAEKMDVQDDAYPDGQIALKAVADLERLSQSSAPFFMAVGFRKPHLPFNAPAKYWVDDVSEVSLPPSWYASREALPAEALHRSAELRMQYDALPIMGAPSTDVAKEIVAGYYAAARFADQQVGLVLEALDTYGLTERTIVVVSGDHGFLLGEQGMWTKHALFEPALRTPLIIAAPSFPGGSQIEAVSDLLDVFPTLADLAGLPKPKHLDGHSLLELMHSPSLQGRAEKPVSVSRWMNGVSMRDGNYRYTRWFDEENNTVAEMLFDVVADPNELQNIADDRALPEHLARLKSQLVAHDNAGQWSEAMSRNVSMWALANSYWGAFLMAGMVYPIQVIIAVLVVLLLIGLVIKRVIRSRK